MLRVDNDNMVISLTRGDTANIVFSAKDENGTTYVPGTGDKIKFAVAKKVGATPIFEIANDYAGDATAFWTITILPENTSEMKFGDYSFDVQLTHDGEIDTIIGVTDEIKPVFRVWGEVATE